MSQKLLLTDRIEQLLLPILADEGLELFEVVIAKSGHRGLVRIFISHPHRPVTLDDCHAVSQAIDLKMEVEDLFPQNAALEVSSVGLDRQLKRQKDFQYFMGEKVKVKTRQPVLDKKRFLGIISDCNDKTVTIKTSDERLINISYQNIAKAKLEISF